MLVVLANRWDLEAAALAQRWSDHEAHVLSPEDLSLVGWRHDLADPATSTAVIGGRVIGVGEISGVLTLLPGIMPEQLFDIIPEDRAYVAAEMTAFLVSWLCELACMVLNPPTPACLMGPNWHSEQWIHTAAGVGIPVRPARRRVSRVENPAGAPTQLSAATATIIGERCFGEIDKELVIHARQLAAVTGVDMLAVHFDGRGRDAELIGADLRPDLSSPEIADAILGYFRGSNGGRRC